MKLPRGFGKNYFSLNAITVTVNQLTLNKIFIRIVFFHLYGSLFSFFNEILEDDDPNDTSFYEELFLALKGCHCNILFIILTVKILKLFCYPKIPLYFYKNLHTDISPP